MFCKLATHTASLDIHASLAGGDASRERRKAAAGMERGWLTTVALKCGKETLYLTSINLTSEPNIASAFIRPFVTTE